MFKKKLNPHYKKFLEAADGVLLPGKKEINFTQPDAHAFFLYPTGIILGTTAGESHGELTNKVNTFIHYYNKGASPESNNLQIDPYPILTTFKKHIEDRNKIDGRIWFSHKIIAFWESSEFFKEYQIEHVFELLKLRGYNPEKFKYHPAELDNSETINGKRYDGVYSYEEFLNALGKKHKVNQKNIDAKMAAHLMDGKYKKELLGIKPKINLTPFANYYTRNESVIIESPDSFDDGDIVHTWTGDDTITFIGDKKGNLILGKRIAHTIMQQVLYAQFKWGGQSSDEKKNAEMEILKSKTKQLKIIADKNELDDFINEIAADIQIEPEKYVRKMTAFSKYSVGRIFVEGNAVSFWNKLEQLNLEQKRAIISIMKRAGIDPEFAEYEVNPPSPSSMGSILTYKEFLEAKESNEIDSRDSSKIEQFHDINPAKKGDVLKRAGIKPKTPSPLFWKQAMYSEKFTESYDKSTPSILKYYAFDWDDNLLHMPTKITVKSSNNETLELSTEEYAKFKNHLKNETNFLYEGKLLSVTTLPTSYDKFRESHDKQFLEEIKIATPGPAWKEFVTAVNNGRIFSIVTARGHHPNTIKEAVQYLITESIGGLDYYICLDNLKLMHEFSHSETNYTDDELFERYLTKLCKYYPVTYNNEDAVEHIEKFKAQAITEFCQHVDKCFNGMNSEFRSRVSNNFVIGFSDDDSTNTSHISEQFDSYKVEVTLTKKE